MRERVCVKSRPCVKSGLSKVGSGRPNFERQRDDYEVERRRRRRSRTPPASTAVSFRRESDAVVKSTPLVGRWERASLQDARECEDLLIVRARQRDRRAFDRLVERHIGPLRAFLRGRVSGEAVEDTLQETLIGAWESLPRYETRLRFRAWLLRIAAHKSVDLHRRQSRRPEMALPEEEPAALDGQRAFESVEQREIVQTMLESLGEAQREVLELYYFAELTLPEIARATGRNLNTVKYQFYAAHSRAARLLEPVWEKETHPR